MNLFAIVSCVELKEGLYELRFDEPDVDSCGVYQEAVFEDVEGEVWWSDTYFTFDFGDGTAVDYQVDGLEFDREAEGSAWLDDNCQLLATSQEEGEITSGTTFEGVSNESYDFEGRCRAYEQLYDPPCLVSYEWRAELVD